jgi:Spy/CpxP family protein refolding chaperone
MLFRDRICAERPASSRAALAERLHLSSEQQARLDSILDERQRRYASVMATVRGQLDSIKLHAREQIRAMLTEEQRQEFEKLLAEMNNPNRSRDDN